MDQADAYVAFCVRSMAERLFLYERLMSMMGRNLDKILLQLHKIRSLREIGTDSPEIDALERETLNFLSQWRSQRRCVDRAFEMVAKICAYAGPSECEPDVRETYHRLAENPAVLRIRVTERVLGIHTIPIVIDHEGVRRITSQFAFLLDYQGRLKVRAFNTRHPKGIPHPHMPPGRRPCFGNLTVSIGQCVLEVRLALAFSHFLNWAVNGYEPRGLVAAKLEEWPETEREVTPC